jgi:hypothetical protein
VRNATGKAYRAAELDYINKKFLAIETDDNQQPKEVDGTENK